MRTAISVIAFNVANEGAASVSEAVADAASSAEQAASIASEEASEVIEQVVEAAAERIEEAEETAERIAQAAMETNLGRRIGEIAEEFRTWRDGEGARLSQQMAAISEQMLTLSQQVAATGALAVAATLEPNSSSTPAPSLVPSAPEKISDAVAETIAILPGETETAPVENTPAAPAPARKVKRFL